jgi:peptidoglycan hydrolase-like protein with peptidoglycan-binding domain
LLPSENRAAQFVGALCLSLLLVGVAAASTTTTTATKPTANHPQTATTTATKPTPSPSPKAHSSSSSAKSHSTSSAKHSSKHNAKSASKSHGQRGISEERTREIQTALILEHYLSGEATGKWDESTKEALTNFQAANGWQTKITPDSRALIKLGLGPDHKGLLNPDTANIPSPHELGSDSAQPGGAADQQ